MHYEEAKKLREEDFQRLTGVKRRTYDKMIEILRPHEEAKRKKGGRKPRLCLEDQVLMALEYWREYRTYFHIGKNYGISESAAYLGIRWIEDTLRTYAKRLKYIAGVIPAQAGIQSFQIVLDPLLPLRKRLRGESRG